MRRLSAYIIGIAAAILWTCAPSSARAADGFWVTLAAGLGTAATSSSEFWFDTPHGPPIIAVTELSGGTMARATTGGGTAHFGGLGTPVILTTTDGAAYLANGNPPTTAVDAATRGNKLASTAPEAGGALPSSAALLGVKLGTPDSSGSRSLTATLTDPNGNPLGSGDLLIPDGGFWIVGLTPGASLREEGPVDPTPIEIPPVDSPADPSPGDPGPVDSPSPIPIPDGGPVAATPEPSAFVLASLGGLGAGLWRRGKRGQRRKTC